MSKFLSIEIDRHWTQEHCFPNQTAFEILPISKGAQE